jgi:hypothetical protein
MGKVYEQIDTRLRTFIEQQPVFFVATAPLAGDGHVNVSPKGRSGSLTVLDPYTVAYLDFGGSHAETLAHLRENGRITLMWCAFTGPPSIVRVHGRGEPVFRDDPPWPGLKCREGSGNRGKDVVSGWRGLPRCFLPPMALPARQCGNTRSGRTQKGVNVCASVSGEHSRWPVQRCSGVPSW